MTMSTAWRRTVLDQADRLDDDLKLTSRSDANQGTKTQIEHSIEAARNAARESSSPTKWLSGDLIERAWFNLGAAREDMSLIQSDHVLRSQLPYLLGLTVQVDSTGELTRMLKGSADSQALDQNLVRQIVREHNVSTAMSHEAVREFRNRMLGTFCVLVFVLCIAAIVVGSTLQQVMGIGALAGTATSILPLVRAQRPSGPYGIAGIQSILKIPAGALTALLAVIVLQNGVLTPHGLRVGETYVWAVVFGFSQQALTGLIDQRAPSAPSRRSTGNASQAKPVHDAAP